MTLIEQVGMVASACLPLWNIPLIRTIVRRRSSADISQTWVVGVWVCSVLMLPSGIVSSDVVFKLFAVINVVLFTGVLIVTFKYRK